MKPILVAAASINTIPLDWDGNSYKIKQCIQAAIDKQCAILCLPELCISGYGCEDMFQSTGVLETAWEQLEDIAKCVPKTLLVSVGLPIQVKGAVYNCVATLSGNKVIGLTAKKHLAGDGVHYETRQFKAWPDKVVTLYKNIPIGDTFFELDAPMGIIRIGYEICEDAWVADRPGMQLAKQGVDIILNPSASHFSFGKAEVRERFVLEGSRAFTCGYVYSNLMGNEAGRIVYDGGNMIAQTGSLVAKGTRLSFKDINITYGILDIDGIKHTQAATASRIPNPENTNNVVYAQVDFLLNHTAPETTLKRWEQKQATSTKEEEFARAVALGLFDYMRKSHTKGFTVSLSGGADSTAVVCLILIMHQLAKEDGAKLPEMDQILTTVYQASENSGDVTTKAARAIATACGAEHHEINVAAIIKEYTQTVEKSFGRKLTWQLDDIALQNIQARSRGPSVWMLANLKNQLLLSTSNRSEAAVGYATMDGDTCGSISPISGISKQYLRKWLYWLMDEGLTLEHGKLVIPEIGLILSQQPTAELRPASQSQTDESDLMPYDVLDLIEDLAIGKKLTQPQVIMYLQRHGHPSDKVQEWTEKFFRLWKRNQWKRERYAPGIHVDDKNLDPRSWCRYPILNK